MLRDKPGVYGLVASDSTVSRDITTPPIADRIVVAVSLSHARSLARPLAVRMVPAARVNGSTSLGGGQEEDSFT